MHGITHVKIRLELSLGDRVAQGESLRVKDFGSSQDFSTASLQTGNDHSSGQCYLHLQPTIRHWFLSQCSKVPDLIHYRGTVSRTSDKCGTKSVKLLLGGPLANLIININPKTLLFITGLLKTICQPPGQTGRKADILKFCGLWITFSKYDNQLLSERYAFLYQTTVKRKYPKWNKFFPFDKEGVAKKNSDIWFASMCTKYVWDIKIACEMWRPGSECKNTVFRYVTSRNLLEITGVSWKPAACVFSEQKYKYDSTIQFLDNGNTCNTTLASRRTFSIVSKHHTYKYNHDVLKTTAFFLKRSPEVESSSFRNVVGICSVVFLDNVKIHPSS
jgi:hypothetical protein